MLCEPENSCGNSFIHPQVSKAQLSQLTHQIAYLTKFITEKFL